MRTIKNLSLLLACAAFAGCAGLNAQRREARGAADKTAGAELAVKEARQAGAVTCASKELKAAETDLQFARTNLQKKEYGMAARFAESAKTSAGAATLKCNEAKKRAKKKQEKL